MKQLRKPKPLPTVRTSYFATKTINFAMLVAILAVLVLILMAPVSN